MRTVEEWKALLRQALKEALRARKADAASALREAMAALDNAEAVDPGGAPSPVESGRIAGAVAGVGRGEVPRRALTPEEASALLDREIEDRREAAKIYEAAGKLEAAAALRQGADALDALRAAPA